jgi:chorismate mutase/prephenate dehydratase
MTPEEAGPQLNELRAQIDVVDREIVRLLNERMRVVEEIGRVKLLTGLPIYEPKRESEVFSNVIGSNGGPLPPDGLRRVFERIIDEARTVQRTRMKPDGGKP